MVMTTTGVMVVIGDGDCGGDRGGDGAWWVVMPPRKVDNSQLVKNEATIVIAHPEHVEVVVRAAGARAAVERAGAAMEAAGTAPAAAARVWAGGLAGWVVSRVAWAAAGKGMWKLRRHRCP